MFPSTCSLNANIAAFDYNVQIHQGSLVVKEPFPRKLVRPVQGLVQDQENLSPSLWTTCDQAAIAAIAAPLSNHIRQKDDVAAHRTDVGSLTGNSAGLNSLHAPENLNAHSPRSDLRQFSFTAIALGSIAAPFSRALLNKFWTG